MLYYADITPCLKFHQVSVPYCEVNANSNVILDGNCNLEVITIHKLNLVPRVFHLPTQKGVVEGKLYNINTAI